MESNKKENETECIKEDATGKKIAKKLLTIIENPEETQKAKNELKKVKESLGGPGAAKRAAEAVVEVLRTNT